MTTLGDLVRAGAVRVLARAPGFAHSYEFTLAAGAEISLADRDQGYFVDNGDTDPNGADRPVRQVLVKNESAATGPDIKIGGFYSQAWTLEPGDAFTYRTNRLGAVYLLGGATDATVQVFFTADDE